MKIGVLNLQGAVSEHVDMLLKCGAEAVPVKKKEHFSDLDGLVIPGGESTTIGSLIKKYGLDEPIKQMAAEGKPIYGTCAGLIVLAARVTGSDVFSLGLMNIRAARNAFGRQRESFETDLAVPALGDEPFRAVFIRAPLIEECGDDVDVLAVLEGRVVAARQGNILVSAFHPELTDDPRFHKYFLSMVKES